MTSVSFDLPFPAKVLWPNGRGHWAQKAKAVRSHRGWAYVAAFSAETPDSERFNVTIHLRPKTRHTVDADNVIAAMKSYLDGIAQGLGVDDKRFNAPKVVFGEPIKGGSVRIEIEAA